jgi:hypothetical protein
MHPGRLRGKTDFAKIPKEALPTSAAGRAGLPAAAVYNTMV